MENNWIERTAFKGEARKAEHITERTIEYY